MKTKALRRFREKLARDEAVHGLWVTLESATITELAVALGLDWVVIDAEHGHLDWRDINEHIRAAVRSDTVVLVRIAERSTSLAKRVLDIGADGVVIPWMETAAQLEEALHDCRYPPQGRRGIGGERATAWGQCFAQHTAEANEHVLVVPLIESVEAIPHVSEMCEVDGADVFLFGPADFSATAGHRGQWEGPGVAQQILALKDTIKAAGKHCGLLTTSLDDLTERQAQGFKMLGLGADSGLLLRSLHQALQTVGADRMPAPSLDPEDGYAVGESPARVPTTGRQSRGEPITRSQRPPFRICQTADFFGEDGEPKFADLGLDVFDGHNHIIVSKLPEHRPQITPDQLTDCHGVIVLTPRVAADSLVGCDNLLAVGRFGVGYDTVDVEACTENDVLAMITAGAVDRPVAEATIGWMIDLTHHTLVKDRLVRTGCWDDRTRYMGCELRDRTLGVIGLGGIGRTLISLLQGFGMRQPIAFDPFVPAQAFADLGVRSVSLDQLLATADFVSIHCPLNDRTRGMIGAAELQRMRHDAYLLNTARGGIVDEDALFHALQSGRIAGAALDCFVGEPVTSPHRFGKLSNVILAPHAIAWTAELFRDIGHTACQSMLDLSLGCRPHGVLNPQLFERDSFRKKWSQLTGIAKEHLP